MVLPRNVEVDPSIPDLKSGRVKRPEEVTITTQVSGLFGPMTNTTVWLTQYDHENEAYREDIVFKEGWLITGRKKERVMPWDVAGLIWPAPTNRRGRRPATKASPPRAGPRS